MYPDRTIQTLSKNSQFAQSIADRLNALPPKTIYGTSAYPFDKYYSFDPVPHENTNHCQTVGVAKARASICRSDGLYRVRYFSAFEDEAKEIELEIFRGKGYAK